MEAVFGQLGEDGPCVPLEDHPPNARAGLASSCYLAHRALSETVLANVRIIAIDQEIVQGGPANNAAAGKTVRTVSLQLAPEQVKKITVAQRLGKLSLSIRAAVDQQDTTDTGTMLSTDVSPELARQSATVVVKAGDKVKEYVVKRRQ